MNICNSKTTQHIQNQFSVCQNPFDICNNIVDMYCYVQKRLINLTNIIDKNTCLANVTAQHKTTMILSDKNF